jgi:DNA-binding XRE family transcriptional regulator
MQNMQNEKKSGSSSSSRSPLGGNAAELARALGIHRVHAWNIINGYRTPSVKLGRKMAEHFQISMDELYKHVSRAQTEAARQQQKQQTVTAAA